DAALPSARTHTHTHTHTHTTHTHTLALHSILYYPPCISKAHTHLGLYTLSQPHTNTQPHKHTHHNSSPHSIPHALYSHADHRALHSSPTRRSADLSILYYPPCISKAHTHLGLYTLSQPIVNF